MWLEVDGEIVEMPGPIPSFEVKGNKKMFYFRIPKFNTHCYDWILLTAWVGVKGSGDAESEWWDTTSSTTQGPDPVY
ncbi:hypothetical protein OS493_016377 [Desmophyllum pertusum]|uniref:Uncharacterized protein n=1 Tax=Desmophyllum pertusum TaxID=174260 RepID=A0A9X0D4E8_9CNID|nr:hypothetical protein OS493_016377 [Desmophyllum pertusum]